MKRMLMLALFALAMGCAVSESEVGTVEDELTLSDGILRQDVYVATSAGRVHVELVARPIALVPHSNRRLIVMVPGTLANGASYYDIAPGSGYNAAEILARAGRHVVALVDLPGTGESDRPADGRDTSVDVTADAVRDVARWLRLHFLIARVDLYGETGVGTNVGLLLSRERWVRSFVASATFYERFGVISGQLFDPSYHAYLDALPDGYQPGDPALLSLFLAPADDSIEAEAIAATLGPAPVTIPTGAFYDIRALGPPTLDVSGPWPVFVLSAPIVRAEPAQAPALFIQGTPDQIGDELGTDELVAAYGATGGGEAELVVIPGASHLMRFDTGISDGPDSAFWAPVIEFIETH